MLISQMERYYKWEKIPSTIFYKNLCFLLGLKRNLWGKAFSSGKTKTNLNFVIKLAERSNHSFSFYLLNHIFQISVLFKNVIIEYIEFNWLCKRMKNVRNSQAVILVLNWVKHSFSLWVLISSLKIGKTCCKPEKLIKKYL